MPDLMLAWCIDADARLHDAVVPARYAGTRLQAAGRSVRARQHSAPPPSHRPAARRRRARSRTGANVAGAAPTLNRAATDLASS
jgi:hypothetical protein